MDAYIDRIVDYVTIFIDFAVDAVRGLIVLLQQIIIYNFMLIPDQNWSW